MNIILLSILMMFSISADGSLTEKLEAKANASSAKAPAKRKKIMNDALKEVQSSAVMKNALKKGATIPHFVLPDFNGTMISSKKILKKSKMVLVFYRGGWCPYCNLQLRDLKKHADKFKQAGATVVAISPQSPDGTAETVKKQGINFTVLSDASGQVIQSFGLNYKLGKPLIDLYKKFGIDLSKSNGNKKWELPLTATYIIDRKGKITYSFIDADYKKRAETSELLKLL